MENLIKMKVEQQGDNTKYPFKIILIIENKKDKMIIGDIINFNDGYSGIAGIVATNDKERKNINYLFNAIRTIIYIFIMFIGNLSYSQTYNNWEIEANVGAYKTTVGTANNYHNYVGTPISIDIGVTHFVSSSFGLKASGAYFRLKSNKHNLSFSTDYFRASALGVWQLDRALDLNKWYGLRLDLGFGYTEFYPDLETAKTNREQAGHIIGTLVNQFEITDRLKINAGIELISHYNMDYTFDGTVSTGDPLDQEIGRNTGISDGTIYNFKVGITYALKIKTINKAIDEDLEDDFNNIEARLAILENKQDTTVIKNIVHKHTHIHGDDPYKEKIYFKYDKKALQISDYVLDNHQISILDKIILKLKDNPNHNLEIVGFADYRGNEDYNILLALERANTVKQFLINAGINTSRLTTISKGERPALNTLNNTSQLDRMVYFIQR